MGMAEVNRADILAGVIFDFDGVDRRHSNWLDFLEERIIGIFTLFENDEEALGCFVEIDLDVFDDIVVSIWEEASGPFRFPSNEGWPASCPAQVCDRPYQ